MSKVDINPFMANTAAVKIKAIRCYSTHKVVNIDSIRIEDNVVLPDSENGFDTTDIGNSFLAEQMQRTSLYRSDVVSSLIKEIDDNSRCMFLYIMHNLKRGKETVRLEPDGYKEFSGKSSSKTFYSAINQLMGSGVIQRKKQSEYWINPLILFNGDRLDKYPKNIEVVAKVKIK